MWMCFAFSRSRKTSDTVSCPIETIGKQLSIGPSVHLEIFCVSAGWSTMLAYDLQENIHHYNFTENCLNIS